MGTVFQKQYTKPIPDNATITRRKGKALAKWKDGRGKNRTAPLNEDETRIVLLANTFTAKYRDESGAVTETPTECTQRSAALVVMTELERKALLIRKGVMTSTEATAEDHASTPISEHIDVYLADLKNRRGKGARKQISKRHIMNVDNALKRIMKDCGFSYLRDLNRRKLEKWIYDRNIEADGLAVTTINSYIESVIAFGNWCDSTDRLGVNPFSKTRRLEKSEKPKHKRRAYTPQELADLLLVARLRPLANLSRSRKPANDEEREKPKSEWSYEPLTLANVEALAERTWQRLTKDKKLDRLNALEREGQTRAAKYKLAALTGLRLQEIESLTLDQFDLDNGYVTLHAGDLKALFDSLLTDSQEQIRRENEQEAERMKINQGERVETTKPIPMALPGGMKPFPRKSNHSRMFNLDLDAAGIAKRDERDRVVDFHSLRVTFSTWLSASGAKPRTAQAAMRHSRLELTMQTYTDPTLLDVAGAVDSLPEIPMDGSHRETGYAQAAGAEHDKIDPTLLAPVLAPDTAKSCISEQVSATMTSKTDAMNRKSDFEEMPRRVQKNKVSRDLGNPSKKAGDEIRTHDIHVGNVTLYH